MGQSSKIPISIGYFAPYGVHLGGKIGTSFELKQLEIGNKSKVHSLSISPQLGYFSYFSYTNVHRGLALDANLDLRRYASNQQFYGLAAIGLSYHSLFEKVSTAVNLGTGETINDVQTTHYFVPTFNLGFGQDPNKWLGYYFKASVGQRINTTVGSSLFVSAELGLTFNLKNE